MLSWAVSLPTTTHTHSGIQILAKLLETKPTAANIPPCKYTACATDGLKFCTLYTPGHDSLTVCNVFLQVSPQLPPRGRHSISWELLPWVLGFQTFPHGSSQGGFALCWLVSVSSTIILKGKGRPNMLKKKKKQQIPRQNVFQNSNLLLSPQLLSLVLIPFIPISDHILNVLHGKVHCLSPESCEDTTSQ